MLQTAQISRLWWCLWGGAESDTPGVRVSAHTPP